MARYIGYPEPSEWQGHLLKRLTKLDAREAEFKCQRCGITGSLSSLRGRIVVDADCVANPTAIKLWISVADFPPPANDEFCHTGPQREEARARVLEAAGRIWYRTLEKQHAMPIEGWVAVDSARSMEVAQFMNFEQRYRVLLNGASGKVAIEKFDN
jgi:hypothetical protein